MNRSLFTRLAAVLLIVAMPTFMFAVGKPSAAGGSMSWDIDVTGHDSIVLTVQHDGEVYTKTFKAGKPVVFNLKDMPSDVPLDGPYDYQLSVVPTLSNGLKKQLEAARATGDEKASQKVFKAAGIVVPQPQSGTFTVLNGSIVDPNGTEGGNNARTGTPTSDGVRSSTPSLSGPASRFKPEVLDQVIPDDLIVQSSTCTGFDCVNGESFGFDTLRLKENNLRIHFDDTSASAGFPANDWRLVANDSASGGANKFVIEDSTAARNPVTIEAAAPANALYVDSTGNIGFQQANPGLDLHLTTTDTPALRLEQTNGGGFTAQTWDIGANEANFFVRDLTGGSRLSFRIRPGAPTSSIDISADGDVGIGTASPEFFVHAVRNTNFQEFLQIENTNAGADANATLSAMADVAQVDAKSHASGRTLVRYGKTLGSWNEIAGITGNGLIVGTNNATPLVLGTNQVNRLEIGAAGGVTITGNLTVTGTKAFAQVDPADSSKAIHYIALEGPEAGTYYRGSAKTVNGEAVIELPGYFSRITENERMTVQLTATGKYGQMYVASKTPERLVIKVAEGTEDLEFDYLVQGIRKGYLDFQVERENTLPK